MIRKDDRGLAKSMTLGFWMVGLAVVCFALTLISLYFFMASVILVVLGLGVILATTLAGLRTERRAGSAEPTSIADCRIVGRYAISPIGEMLFNDLDIDFEDPKTRLFIRLQPPHGISVELRTHRHVWQSCGEGMQGMAMVQGDWLGGFTPRIGEGSR